MNQQAIFKSLVQNAFDFLERGIADFGNSPKYSVIHFCAAVEMFIKARLMQEHWSLIVSKPDQADLSKFIVGNFESVTLAEARSRLSAIAHEEIPNEAFSSFRELANHRNKIIHFFHADIEGDERARETIVAEHCRSWFQLHRLLCRWNDHFGDFETKISRADHSMKEHRQYLSAKYKALNKELDVFRNSDNPPRTCNSCGFKSAIPDPIDDHIAIVKCKVCDHIETQVQIECPQCEKTITIANEGYGTCEHCNKIIEPDDIGEALADHGAAHFAAQNGDDSLEPASCDQCDGYQTVINRSGIYFCTNCFGIFDHIECCEWCNEPNTGDMEHSYVTGCNHCEGHTGWHKDD